MPSRILFLPFVVLVLFIQSCAPKLTYPGYCENKFKEQILIDNKIPESFSFTGSAIISGLPVIIRGNFSKNSDTLNLASPFGKDILIFERKEGNVCVKATGFQSCNGEEILSMISLYAPHLTTLTDINLLKGVIGKKFYLTEGDKFECDGKQLKVLRKDYTLIYQEGTLSQIIYKNYRVEYGLNNQIEIKDGSSTLAKINISSINFFNNN